MMRNIQSFLGLLIGGTILVGTASAQTAAKPPSPFLLCDGRTGHVGLGETLGRLIAITATAGLSETVTTMDDPEKRVKGAAAAEACSTAIAQEGDSRRRVELAMARAIHLVEADQLVDARTAVSEIPRIAGPLEADWGYQHTLRPRVQLLEADLALRQMKLAEAQQLAVTALATAPYDLDLANRALRYLDFFETMDPAREAALRQIAHLMPERSAVIANIFARSGRYADAEALIASLSDLATPFFTDFRNEGLDSVRALYQALAGKGAESDALAAGVRVKIKGLAATGWAVNNAGEAARINENLLLRDIYRDAQRGQGSDARARFKGHGDWLLAPGGALPLVVALLRQGAPASDLTGSLAMTPDQINAQHRTELIAALTEPKLIQAHYRQATYFAKGSEYASAAAATWKISGKRPRFLLKPGKEQLASTDVLSTLPAVNGLPAGEAILLQAALIARSRGADGFVTVPGRGFAGILGMRTGTLGSPGMPRLLAFDADKVITDLSPAIPEPLPPR